MQPYILYDWVLDPTYFIVAWGYFVSSGGSEPHGMYQSNSENPEKQQGIQK